MTGFTWDCSCGARNPAANPVCAQCGRIPEASAPVRAGRRPLPFSAGTREGVPAPPSPPPLTAPTATMTRGGTPPVPTPPPIPPPAPLPTGTRTEAPAASLVEHRLIPTSDRAGVGTPSYADRADRALPTLLTPPAPIVEAPIRPPQEAPLDVSGDAEEPAVSTPPPERGRKSRPAFFTEQEAPPPPPPPPRRRPRTLAHVLSGLVIGMVLAAAIGAVGYEVERSSSTTPPSSTQPGSTQPSSTQPAAHPAAQPPAHPAAQPAAHPASQPAAHGSTTPAH